MHYSNFKLNDFQSRNETLDDGVRTIQEMTPSVDVIAFTGISGACFGFPLAMLTDTQYFAVRRKDEVGNHGNCYGEMHPSRHYEDYCHVLIVDDFLDTGSTFEHVLDCLFRLLINGTTSHFLEDVSSKRNMAQLNARIRVSVMLYDRDAQHRELALIKRMLNDKCFMFGDFVEFSGVDLIEGGVD